MDKYKFTYNEKVRSIINYDLEDNDVSANEIAAESKYLNTILHVNNKDYDLPMSTLTCPLGRDAAINEFYRALKNSGSESEVLKLYIVEINNKDAYIEND